MAPTQTLTSWKEIADYLAKGIRTVQRWEKELHLPVRRIDDAPSRIIANRADLDAWIQSDWSRRPQGTSETQANSANIEEGRKLIATSAEIRAQIDESSRNLQHYWEELRRELKLPPVK